MRQLSCEKVHPMPPLTALGVVLHSLFSSWPTWISQSKFSRLATDVCPVQPRKRGFQISQIYALVVVLHVVLSEPPSPSISPLALSPSPPPVAVPWPP
jgi:hypothetical protein